MRPGRGLAGSWCFAPLLCLALLLGGAGSAHAAPRKVVARVLAADGAPVEHATAELTPRPGPLRELAELLASAGGAAGEASIAETGQDGELRLSAPDPGLWRVVVHAPGFLPTAFDLSPLFADDGEEVRLPSVHLTPGRPLRVRVTDPDGSPLQGARVVAETLDPPTPRRVSGLPWTRSPWRLAPERAVTDGAGLATVHRAGRLTLTVFAPGHPLGRAEVGDPDGTGDLVVRLAEGRPVILEVRDAEASPIPGIAVALDGVGVGMTDTAGRLRIFLSPDVSAPASVRLLATDGRWGVVSAVPPGDGEGVREREPMVVATLRAPALRRLRIVDARSGAALAGAIVWPGSYPALARACGPNGSVDLAVPFSGAPRVRAAAARHVETVAEIAGGEGASAVVLRPAGQVRGRVIDDAGRPIAGADLQLALPDRTDVDPEAARWSASGSDGAFRLAEVPAGPAFWLRAAAPGHAPARLAVTGLERAEPFTVVLARAVSAAGTVVDGSGLPVAGASVRALPSAPAADAEAAVTAPELAATATSGADGGFRLESLPPGPIDLRVEAEGYAPAQLRGVRAEPVRSGGPALLPAIALEPEARVAGLVVDPRGAPLAGVRVSQVAVLEAPVPTAVAETVTDPEGTFSLGGMDEGAAVLLRLERAGYVSRTVDAVAARAPQAEPYELTPAAALAGTVRNRRGEPVAGAVVFARPEPGEDGRVPEHGGLTRSDGEGRFSLDGLAAGRFRVGAVSPRHPPAEVRVEAADGEVMDGIELVLPDGATVAGVVIGPDGEPVAGVALVIGQSDGAEGGLDTIERPTALSDEDGVFLLEGVAPGPRTLVASHPDYLETRRPVRVSDGGIRIDVRLGAGSSVSGRAVDSVGTPVAGATIRLAAVDGAPGPDPATTGADGRFRFAAVAPGSYALIGEAGGLAAARAPGEVRVGGAAIVGLEVVLETGGAISGRVLGLGPRELVGLEVRASTAGLPGRAATVDARGSYRVEGLAAGDWTVAARVPGVGREASERVTLDPGQAEAYVDLPWVDGFTLTGSVTEGGEPIAGALVGARSEGGAAAGAVTEGGGRFAIEDLPAGSYLLTVLDRSGGRSASWRVVIDGDRDVRLDLSPAPGPQDGGSRRGESEP